MSILGRLALIFVLVPILELVLLVKLGQVVGLWPTLLLVVSTGVAGAALARAEGLRVLWAFQREVASGRLPGQSLLDGICVLIGGAFLLTPGILTDLTGFSLLLPPTRRWIQRRVRARLQRSLEAGTVRFVSMRTGWGAASGSPFPGAGDAGGTGRSTDPGHGATPDLDPRHGIVIDVDRTDGAG